MYCSILLTCQKHTDYTRHINCQKVLGGVRSMYGQWLGILGFYSSNCDYTVDKDCNSAVV